MVARTLWLWICIGWLMAWLGEAVINPGTATICDLSPCQCVHGKLQCDCSTSLLQEVTLSDQLMGSFSFSTIRVANCAHVYVLSRALSGLPVLQQISIANITTLSLAKQAFIWRTDNHQLGGLQINITNCAIPEVPSYCFRGSLRDILLTSVNITLVRTFAFASIDHAERIDFEKVNIAVVEPQSFKKFSVEFLTFRDSYVALFQTRTVTDVDVHQEVRLDNVRVDRFEIAAIKVNEPRNFRIMRSTIGHVEPNAFIANAKGDVSIHDNSFFYVAKEAFIGFTVDSKYLQEAGKQDLVFENNTMVNFESASLTFNTTGFSPRLDWIMINQSCSCVNAQSWATDLVISSSNYSSDSLPLQVSKVMFCLNPGPMSVAEYQRLHCNSRSSLVVKASIIAVAVLLLCLLCTVVYCCFKKRGKRYINVPTSPSALKPAHNNKPHMLVVPDGKTYRETEMHVIVEHAEPIINTEYIKERPDVNENR